MLYCCYLHHALLLLITFISILSQVIQVGRQLLLHHSQVTLQVTLDEPSFSQFTLPCIVSPFCVTFIPHVTWMYHTTFI